MSVEAIIFRDYESAHGGDIIGVTSPVFHLAVLPHQHLIVRHCPFSLMDATNSATGLMTVGG